MLGFASLRCPLRFFFGWVMSIKVLSRLLNGPAREEGFAHHHSAQRLALTNLLLQLISQSSQEEWSDATLRTTWITLRNLQLKLNPVEHKTLCADKQKLRAENDSGQWFRGPNLCQTYIQKSLLLQVDFTDKPLICKTTNKIDYKTIICKQTTTCEAIYIFHHQFLICCICSFQGSHKKHRKKL